jgi:hypothetical protein
MAMDFSEMPQVAQTLGSTTMQMGMVVRGSVLYMKFPAALAAAVPGLGGKQWIKLDLAKLSGLPGVSSLTNNPTMSDPSHMLQYLRAASDSVTQEGEESVNGVATTHYRAELNLDRLQGGLPADDQRLITRELSKLQQVTGSGTLPIDVWIDAHHLVRRMVMSLGLHAPDGPSLQETVTVDMTDYGPQPRPAVPSADHVADVGSLLGSSLSGAGALG